MALSPQFFGCPTCAQDGSPASLEVRYALSRERAEALAAVVDGVGVQRSMWDWAPLLPPHDVAHVATLGEGWTPLLPAPHVAAAAGVARLHVKVEGSNPTGSFKDRLNALTVTMARQFDYTRVLATSTGNHGVSLAAYAAAAGMECVVATEPGASPLAVQQMRYYGARVVLPQARDGGGADPLAEYIARLVREGGWWPSVRNAPRPVANPFGMEGYKTIAFEVWAKLGKRLPDWFCVPTGGGDSLAGVAKGFWELATLGMAAPSQTLVAAQPEAACSLVQAYRGELAHVAEVPVGPTRAISLTTTRSGDHGLHALRERGAHADGRRANEAVAIPEAALDRAISLLAHDGFCVDPASAASVAAVLQLAEQGRLGRDAQVVCLLTASGTRWPAAFAGISPTPEPVYSGGGAW